MLPEPISNSRDLSAQNDNLKQLRSQFRNAATMVQTGAFSGKKQFRGILSSITLAIENLKSGVVGIIVPKNRFADYEAGLATIDAFASDDMVAYYSGLNLLSLIYAGAQVAINQISDTQPQSTAPNYFQDGMLVTLADDEFTNEGYSNPTSEIRTINDPYIVKSGDSLQTIAFLQYGDRDRALEIGMANGIDNDDLPNMLGITINIPRTAVESQNSQVFEKTGDPNKNALGTDIHLENKKIVPGYSGDFASISGPENVKSSIFRRWTNMVNTGTSLDENWGFELFKDEANMPPFVGLYKTIMSFISQAEEDPRVVSCDIDLSKIKIVGSQILLSASIALVGNQELTFGAAI